MQIHPVVSRLCASIQGTSPERLADCLGLDSSKVIIFFVSSPVFNNKTFLRTSNVLKMIYSLV